MKLTLKNFKRYNSLDLEFEKNGLYKLAGPSGAGKSTIFQAIKANVDGGLKGTEVKPWDFKGAPSVTINGLIPGITQVRSYYPNDFSFGSFVGGVAEAEMEKALGMTAFEFVIASYANFTNLNSLLDVKSSAKMMKIIQNLIHKDQNPDHNPEKLKERINKKITELKSECDKKESIFAYANHALQSLEETRAEVIRDAEMPAPKNPGLDLEALEEEKSSLEESRHAQKAALEEAERAINNPLYGVIEKIDNDIKSKRVAESLEEDRLSEYQKQKDALEKPWVRYCADEAAATIDDLKDKADYLKQLNEMILLAKQVREKNPDLNDVPPKEFLPKLKEKLISARKDIEESAATVSSLKIALDDLESMKTQECPHCQGSVIMIDEVLRPATDSEAREREIGKIKMRLATQEPMLVEANQAADELSKDIHDMERMKGSLRPDPIPQIKTTKELEAEAVKFNKYWSENVDLQSQHDSLDSSIDVSKKIISGLRAEIYDMEQNSKKINNLEPLPVLVERKQTLIGVVSGISDQLLAVSEKINAANTYLLDEAQHQAILNNSG